MWDTYMRRENARSIQAVRFNDVDTDDDTEYTEEYQEDGKYSLDQLQCKDRLCFLKRQL